MNLQIEKEDEISSDVSVNALYEQLMEIIASHPSNQEYLKGLDDMYQKYKNHMNKVNPSGLTLLMKAARGGMESQASAIKLMQFLVDKKVDTSVVCDRGWTALHYACASSDIEKARLLLKNMQKIDQVTEQDNTVLHLAVHYTGHHLLDDMIGRVDINAVDYEGNTALHDAANKNRIEAIKILVSQGVDITIKNKHHETAFQAAEKIGHHDIALYLQGAEVALKERGALSGVLGEPDQGAAIKLKNQGRGRL